MAWPDSAGTCQFRQTGPAGSILQLGRRPDLSGLGSAALDVGRCDLLQDPAIAARVRERAVPSRTQRGPSVRTGTSPDHTAPGAQHRYFLDAGGADADIACPAEIEPTRVVCSSAKQIALDRSVVRCSKKDRALAGTNTSAVSRKRGRGRTRKGGAE